MLGAVPRAEARGDLHPQALDAGGDRDLQEGVQHRDVHQRDTVLRVHDDKPPFVQHNVEQVQGGVQGKGGFAEGENRTLRRTRGAD